MSDFESIEVEQDQEFLFHKRITDVVDRRYYSVLAASIFLHVSVVLYFLANPLATTDAVNKLSLIHERLGELTPEPEVNPERFVRLELSEVQQDEVEKAQLQLQSQTASQPATGAESSMAGSPASGEAPGEVASASGSSDEGATTESDSPRGTGSRGILGLLTSSESGESKDELADVLGSSGSTQSNLDQALSGVSDLQGGKSSVGSNGGTGSSGDIKGGRNQQSSGLDGHVSGLGKTKSSAVSRGGELVVVNETPLIEATGEKGIIGRDQDDIQAVVARHNSSVQYCFERELNRNPNLKGKLVVRFSIRPDGSVSDAQVISSTLNNRRVEQCIVSRMRRWNDFGEINPTYGETTIRQAYAFGY